MSEDTDIPIDTRGSRPAFNADFTTIARRNREIDEVSEENLDP